MGDNIKSDNYRLTLKFSPKSEDQMKAWEIIQKHGRKKSAFISAAVLYYIENIEKEKNSLANVDRAVLQNVVMGIMKAWGYSPNVPIPGAEEAKTEHTFGETNAVEPTFEKPLVSENIADAPIASQVALKEPIEDTEGIESTEDMDDMPGSADIMSMLEALGGFT